MVDITLIPEQETQAQRLAAIIGKRAQEEALQMALKWASVMSSPALGVRGRFSLA